MVFQSPPTIDGSGALERPEHVPDLIAAVGLTRLGVEMNGNRRQTEVPENERRRRAPPGVPSRFSRPAILSFPFSSGMTRADSSG